MRFLVFFALLAAAKAQTWNISTVAGGALPVNLPGTSANLYGPQPAMATDSAGNLYFADGNTVLRLDALTGMLTLIAGNGAAGYSGDNGPAIAAQLNDPRGIAIDSTGAVYIASHADHTVRRVAGGTITTIAGTGSAGFSGDNGPANAAQLNAPIGLAIDAADNLYIADAGNSRVRKVAGGVITTVAGTGIPGFSGDNGPALAAQLFTPDALAFDAAGNLYIGDYFANRIRKVSGGTIVTVAGNSTAGFSGDTGPATLAQLNSPYGIAVDAAGNLFIADYYNNRIRMVTNGIISTVAGTGIAGLAGDTGPATSAQLNSPLAITVDAAGNLYFSDSGNNRIRRIASGVITTVAGNSPSGFSGDSGSATSAQLHQPAGVALDVSGNLYVSDMRNNRIRKISHGVISTVAGNGTAGFGGDGGPATSALLSLPTSAAVDASGNLYIADAGNNRIRKVTGSAIATIAGSSAPALTALSGPAGVALDSAGSVYIADAGNNRIRKISGAAITTIAGVGTSGFSGDGGPATSAELHHPTSVAVDASGDLYIADTGNNRIRKISNGTITTIAGNGSPGLSGDNGAATSAQLNAPAGVAVGPSGDIYVADTANNLVRRVAGGVISTIAGGGTTLGDGGPATSASLAAPQGIATDGAGNIYIADTENNRVRKMTPAPLSVSGPLSLPAGVVGTVYTGATLTATGGTGSYTWSATGLPKGITLSTGGALAGTPTAAGTSSIRFTVKDSANASAIATLSLTVTLPPPVITTLTPTTITAYSAAFKLTVTGTGFVSPATLQWNGSSISATVVSATQLTAQITAAMIGGAGNVSVTVTAGGAVSAPSTLTVTPQPPAITTVSPASAIATGAAFILAVNGTGFTQASQIGWNGTALPTTFISATQITAYITANLIASAGNATIVITDGAATSGSVKFAINAPPAITSLSPSSVVAGGAAFTLAVTGTGFAQSAQVQWNGAPLTTTYVSATQVTAAVSAAQIAAIASITIQVTLGGASSNGIAFTIAGPPAISALSPASAAVGSAFTLTVTGTGFSSTSIVQWNGAAMKTTYVDPTQLTAAITATQTAAGGSANVTVLSSGVASSAVTFAVVAPAITPGGVVPIYSAVPVIQPGSWVSIYGSGLATSTAVWTGNFPTTLGGVSVTIDNKKAYLWSVSPSQINLQAPDDTASGTVNVVVTSGTKSLTSTVTLARYGPSFSQFPGSSYASGVILTPNKSGAYASGAYDLAGPIGKFAFNTRPVKPGETIELFGVGFGPTNPTVPAGKAFSGAAPTTNPVTITIGGVPAQVLFAGITGAGMYQFNIVVPALNPGDQKVVATVAGNQTPDGVVIAVQ